MKTSLCAAAALLAAPSFAQYYVDTTVTIEDTAITAPALKIPVSPNRYDVRNVGMGNVRVAGGSGWLSMYANPANLAVPARRFDLVGLTANLPPASLDAGVYLKDNMDQFKGKFLEDIGNAYGDLQDANTLSDSLSALRSLQSALSFPNNLHEKFDGKTHGLSLVPDVGVQWDNFAFTLHGVGQAGFIVSTGDALDQLLTLDIPTDGSSIEAGTVVTLLSAINSLFDAGGNVRPEALPQVFAAAYADMVGTLGYGRALTTDLQAGVAVKVVNRRFSAKNITVENFDGIYSESLSEFKTSATGVTADVGFIYTLPAKGTRLGLSVQNIIPMAIVSSTAQFKTLQTEAGYLPDADGNYIVNADGDTALFVVSRYVDVDLPLKLTSPLLVNLGVQHPVTPAWDLALEWSDLLSNDDLYAKSWHRFRLGTEYRLWHQRVALRTGFGEGDWSVGAGLNLHYVSLDAAYGHDSFVDDESIFLQVRAGL